MISHASLLARDGLDLIVEHQKEQSTTYGIDSIEPKCHELEEMKKNLCESLDEKRQNLKLLRTYVDKLEAVRLNVFLIRLFDITYIHHFRSIFGVHVAKICSLCIRYIYRLKKRLDL